MNTRDTIELNDELQKGKVQAMSVQTTTLYEVIFAFLVTALMVWIGYYLINPTTLPIKQVRIEGEFRYLSTSALQELVRNKVRGGFFNINVTAVRNAVLTEPWVLDVSVHRVWPDGLQVFVSEQTAVARWKDTGLLNKSGEFFAPEKTTFPMDLPILAGPEGTQAIMMEKYLYLQKLLLPFDVQLAELYLNDRRSWLFQLDNGLRVVLGKKDFDNRVARFIDLVPITLGSKLYEAEQIDMRYPNGFAVRWKQGGAGIREESGA
ncbi:MAG: FtsQ-type POTRA domain-containing protein [Gammaproteobacteria bacterium]|nr:FtsQ-type POTRA domain-containing protein [Gammaproteobacteria bacterium]